MTAELPRTAFKSVLVTGASRGIGRACARELVRAGWRVFATARTEPALASLAIESSPCEILAADLCNPDGRNRLAAWLANRELHSVVHCLGGKPADVNADPWRSCMELNFLAVVALNELLIPKLTARGGGTIVHVSSSAASHGYAFTPYACAKSALNRYIINEGRNHIRKGVSITGIMPGAVEGDDNHWEAVKRENPARYSEVSRRQALGRLHTTEEVAQAVAWLCSSDARIFAGCVLPADPVA